MGHQIEKNQEFCPPYKMGLVIEESLLQSQRVKSMDHVGKICWKNL